MKGSLIVVGFFALGCLLGWSGWLPDVVIENDIMVYVLYLLMFQVGLSIGSDKKLKDIPRQYSSETAFGPFGYDCRDTGLFGFGRSVAYAVECI